MSSGWPGVSSGALSGSASPPSEAIACGRLRQLASRFFEAFDEHGDEASGAQALEDVLSPGVELHTMTPFRPVVDKAGIISLAQELKAATGGFATVDRFLCNEADGTWAVQYTFTGTFERPLWGLQPTGRVVSIPGTLVARCDPASGQKKISRIDSYVDTFSAATQLGVDVCTACEQACGKTSASSSSSSSSSSTSASGSRDVKSSGEAASGGASSSAGSSGSGVKSAGVVGGVPAGGAGSGLGSTGSQPAQLRETALGGAVGHRPTA